MGGRAPGCEAGAVVWVSEHRHPSPCRLPSLPIVVLTAHRWRSTYRGLHLKVNRDLPRLERVLRTLKVSPAA